MVLEQCLLVSDYTKELMRLTRYFAKQPLELQKLPALPITPPTMTAVLDRESRDQVIQRHRSRFGMHVEGEDVAMQ